jgi:4-hydroxybenzoate polyprenyltransferase
MEQFKLFIELTRLKKPIGYMLLFWPCSWGLTLAYDFTGAINVFLIYLILFFTGSVLMRSAGCIVNDIVDRNFDKKVSRTKNRPIASGEVNLFQGLLYSVVLCAIAFVVLIQFNLLTIILAIGSMPLAFTYPLMKRYTYWPQLYLGITFNYGVILGWTSITNELNLLPVIFFIGAIFWTLAYDTIYGFQDIKDDEIIGLKSTSIKFKHNPYLFLKICYLFFLLSLIIIGLISKFKLIYFLFLILVSLHMFYFQISKLNIRKEESCLKIFKTNNLLGLMVFFSILVGKIL